MHCIHLLGLSWVKDSRGLLLLASARSMAPHGTVNDPASNRWPRTRRCNNGLRAVWSTSCWRLREGEGKLVEKPWPLYIVLFYVQSQDSMHRAVLGRVSLPDIRSNGSCPAPSQTKAKCQPVYGSPETNLYRTLYLRRPSFTYLRICL